MNALLWGIAFIMVAAGVVGNYQFADQSLLYRLIGMLVLFGLAFFFALRTSQGSKFLTFAQESRNELRKVVWPNRKEAMQMTGIVLLMVTVVGLILWGIDAILLRLFAWITGVGV